MRRDAIAGAVYGLALGDALGKPTEFMKLPEIWKRYGRSGYRNLPKPALFTDDTQMTIAVARALKRTENLTPADLTWNLRMEFLRWARLDPPRAPGATCMTAIGVLRRGRSWIDASVVRSKGCGANMRTLPTAFLADEHDARGASQLQAAMTHGHPTALAATELTALAIRWAAEADHLQELPGRLLAHAERRIRMSPYNRRWLGDLGRRRWPLEGWAADTTLGWREAARYVKTAARVAQKPNAPADACLVVGDGWCADDALGAALYFVLRYGHDPVLTISEASRTSGDSDSIACIAGAIVGAFYGEKVWPKRWLNIIERRDDLEMTIDVTHALS